MMLQPVARREEAGVPDGDTALAPSTPCGLIDFCTRDGAGLLKQRIEAYWKERGFEVSITLQNMGFQAAMRAVRYEVRSDLVNGLPRRRGPP